MIPGSANPLLLAAAAEEAGAYQISRSVRLNSADSAYFSRTPASAGNQKTWTWSGWIKRAKLGTYQTIFGRMSGSTDATWTAFRFQNNDKLVFLSWNTTYRLTTQVFRDASAWYHLVVTLDTTQATAADRLKIYVNGSQITTFDTNNAPTQNADLGINGAAVHGIGYDLVQSTNAADFYLADVHFIDGQALDPTSFTEVDATTGQLVPIAYSGTYGTNGFHLPFSDNSTAAALGTDTSGNSNTWTVNNISVAAGAGNDSLVDTPTNYGTDTGAGGEVRGNYATWNPLTNGSYNTLSNGNLDTTGNTNINNGNTRSTIGFKTGKWYSEMTVLTTTPSTYPTLGIILAQDATTPQNGGLPGQVGYPANSVAYELNGVKRIANSTSSYGSSYTTGDVIGIAVDADNGAVYFSKNGTWQNSGDPTSGASKTGAAFTWTGGSLEYVFGTAQFNGSSSSQNFGQRPFAYTAPSGFKALCTTNLPDPLVAKPSEVMDVLTYIGNGTSQTVSGLDFDPDFVWLKSRSLGESHLLMDTVRGTGTFGLKKLFSNATWYEDEFYADSTREVNVATGGISLSGGGAHTNQSSATYVAWTWDAGSSTVTNTDGSITSQVRANPTAGFSIVTYTGTGSAATVGHGLGVAPSLVLVKIRSQAGNWQGYHASLGKNYTIKLNTTEAQENITDYWGTGGVTSSVVGLIGGGYTTNVNGATHVAYCFAPVDGYSSFGSYVANNTTDNVFVYLGFKPAFLLIKNSTTGGSNLYHWCIYDNKRSTYNSNDNVLWPSSSVEENNTGLSPKDSPAGNGAIDFLSNGFKIRSSGSAMGGPDTYIYAAFAENPFKYARAR